MEERLTIHTADAMEISLEIAGIGSRSYAFIIDWHIRFILAVAWLALCWLLAIGVDSTPLAEVLEGHFGWLGLLIIVPPLLIYVLYHPVLELAMHGRTPGKRMTGVRIVTLGGETPGAGALLIRNVFRLIDSLPAFYVIGFVTTLLTRHQVRIGDLAAGTVLVYEAATDKTALDETARLIVDRDLRPEDQELLLDLLERWKSLGRERRIDLARRFLERVGAAVPQELSDSTLDRTLHQKLRRLAGRG